MFPNLNKNTSKNDKKYGNNEDIIKFRKSALTSINLGSSLG